MKIEQCPYSHCAVSTQGLARQRMASCSNCSERIHEACLRAFSELNPEVAGCPSCVQETGSREFSAVQIKVCAAIIVVPIGTMIVICICILLPALGLLHPDYSKFYYAD